MAFTQRIIGSATRVVYNPEKADAYPLACPLYGPFGLVDFRHRLIGVPLGLSAEALPAGNPARGHRVHPTLFGEVSVALAMGVTYGNSA